jgi:hypothetical protein
MAKGGKYRTMVEQQIHMTLGDAAAPKATDGESKPDPSVAH